jgi:hypothetical protein
MSRLLRSFVVLVMLSAASLSFAAQPSGGSIRGDVTDSSGGVLPGVTVVALGSDGRVLASTVTSDTGEYVIDGLPAGPTRVTFELEGFASSMVALLVQPGVQSHVSRRMGLAPLAETVVVYGKSPVEPPPPSRFVRPVPIVIPVVEHDHESVCGPAKPESVTPSLGTIVSRPEEPVGAFYIEGHEILIDGGTLAGLDVGRNFVVRRIYRANTATGTAKGEHSSGLVQIVAADERVSRAVVVYACDEIMKGDYLASFNPEPVRIPDPIGIPAYWDASRILFADIGQLLGTIRRLMVIDRGATSGIRAGQRLTIFRPDDRGVAVPSVVGDAVVVAVRAESATIRILSALDVIAFGDQAAPQRYSPVSPLAASAAP